MILSTVDKDGVARLTLQRPDQRNALNTEMLLQLKSALGEFGTETRALMVCAQGPAFCAGADLKERQSMTALQRQRHNDSLSQLCDRLEEFPVPVVAAIQGYCLAGGAELALACDMRVACEDAGLL